MNGVIFIAHFLINKRVFDELVFRVLMKSTHENHGTGSLILFHFLNIPDVVLPGTVPHKVNTGLVSRASSDKLRA